MCKIIFLSQEVVWVKPFRTEKVWRCEEHSKDFSTEGWRKRIPKICPTKRAIDAGDSVEIPSIPNAGAVIKSDGFAIPTQRN